MSGSAVETDRTPRERRRAAPRRSTAPPRCSPTWSRPTHPVTFAELSRGPGPGPVHDLAAARGPGAQPAAGALAHRRVRRRPAVRALRRPARPQRAAGPARAPDARARSARSPARPCTSPWPTAAGSSTSPRSTRPTCSAPATGPTSRSRRTARHSARSSSPGTCCRGPPAGWRRRPGTRLRSRGDLDVDLAQVRTRGFAVTRDELEVGLAGVAAPGVRDRATAPWSRPSGSPDPRHGSRTGSTRSAGC